MMYQAFARLFLEKAQLNPSNVISLKRRFTALVIIICMEQQKCRKLSREVSYKVPVVEERDTVELFHMPAKTMIDALRAVNFESRMVYNMAVIDGIKMHEVTRILHISIDSANEYLQLAREQLVELFGQMASEQV
jgi:DNA-directed RNA polymerase specialized sigma24 family protein